MTILLIALVVALPACGDFVESPAATVDGQKITVKRVNDALDLFAASAQFDELVKQQDSAELERQYEQSFLSRLIRSLVLEKAARDAGIEVSSEDVANRFDEIKADFENEDAFLAEVKKQGVTVAQVEAIARDSLLEERLRAHATERIAPSDEDLRAFYDENIREYTEVHVAHILVEDNATAIDILDRLRAAPSSEVEKLFAELARKFSTDPGSKKRGGDLGFVPAAQFVEPFANAALRLDIGAISNPVRTEFGFHIIRLIDRRATPLEEVRGDIVTQMTGDKEEQAWQEFLAKAYAAADVEVNPRYGVLDPTQFFLVNASAADIPGAETPPPTPTPGEQPAPPGEQPAPPG